MSHSNIIRLVGCAGYSRVPAADVGNGERRLQSENKKGKPRSQDNMTWRANIVNAGQLEEGRGREGRNGSMDGGWVWEVSNNGTQKKKRRMVERV